jgi:hypothetical protein
LKTKSCQHCIFAVQPAGFTGPVLVCTNKPDCPGKLIRTKPDDCCRNFQARRKTSHRAQPPPPDSEDVRFIPLTQGKFAIVDADDYERLATYKWCASQSGNRIYAVRRRQNRTITMQRQIMNAPEGLLVDHIDGNSLNNRKSNLRLCSAHQNACNRRPRRNSSSKYKGVSWYKRDKKWQVQIYYNARTIHLGRFDDEVEAALVYDRKATELFGEFAYLNFPGALTDTDFVDTD